MERYSKAFLTFLAKTLVTLREREVCSGITLLAVLVTIAITMIFNQPCMATDGGKYIYGFTDSFRKKVVDGEWEGRGGAGNKSRNTYYGPCW